MLGDFSVSCNGSTLISESNRNNKVIHLFQYLFIKHGQAVRQDELISQLFSDSNDYEDPVHTLKNIVYRLRKFLATSELPEREYIFFKKGAYGLCGDIEYEIDVEQFENAVNNAKADDCSEDKRLDYCLEAISLYSGDFLPKSTNMLWVMPRVVRYQEKFYYCVRMVYNILMEKHNLAPMIELFEKVLRLYPYEEQFHLLHISCLYSLKRIKEAINEYDFATTLLFDELGVSPSAEMLELYNKITETLNMASTTIEELRDDMNEETLEKGAYYCNFQIFTNIYRLIVRHAERSGQTAFLVLMTFNETESSKQNSPDTIQKITGAFHNAMRTSLRRGDVYARCSPSQFIILLMDINQENCRVVANRISENFYKQIKAKNAKLTWKVMSAIDVDRVMSH